ncbi:MAG TPA: DCC1-like thiol-disulfide oxidoreductase family protein [Thermohalobaculum sp.]|nr:DCC1-like thiol-disulfide oxidoreductase family protein [Thermohalobaculum sp.]
MDRQGGNYLIYDGECPFCSRYARLTRLRAAVGGLRLINARDRGPEVEAAIRAGYELDQGMLLSLDGQLHYGADCLNRLALMSSRSTLFNRLTYALFRSPRASRLMYPVLRAGRNLVLRLMGRRRLGY